MASYFCRLLSADYTVVTEIKYHREPRQFLLNYLFPRSEKMFTYSYLCFADYWPPSSVSFCELDDMTHSVRTVKISGRKDKLCYFPLWKSVFICSNGFYSSVFLHFHDYWLRYRRGPGVLIGLLTYLTPLDINGSWRQRPLGIKVYKRAEEVFPDYAQEVNYYRAQEPVMEFRYFAPVNRLQVLIDNDNVTLADLLACCEKTSAWAEGV